MSSEPTASDTSTASIETKVPSTAVSIQTELRVSISPSEVMERLDRAARRGKLPGLRHAAGSGEFVLTDFGRPFESELIGSVEAWEGGAVVRVRHRIKPMLPVVFGVILAVSVWPGVLLTDSMLKLYFSWYTIPTWWWYLPLTVPFCPLAWRKAWRQSWASGNQEGAELMETVKSVVGGTG